MLIKSYRIPFIKARIFSIFVRMRATNYIEELLYRYNCVIMPGFGAFLTQHRSAALHRETNTFEPPTKEISFNQQLVQNDGLLASYIAHAESKEYDQVLLELERKAAEWKQELEDKQVLNFGNIGEISLNAAGKMTFRPANAVNFLTASFGLSSVVSPKVTREVLKEEVQELEEKIPFIITPERRKSSRIRPYMKYAAVLLLAFATGVSGYRLFRDQQGQQLQARQEANQLVQQNIQEATFFDTSPLELPVIQLDIAKVGKAAPEKNHHVIAGAFRFRENADKKVNQLKRKGFSDARYLGQNNFGLYQVTYGSFSNPQEALKFLREVKANVSKDAWLLSKK